MTDASAWAETDLRRWRVGIAGRADLVFALRDYLRRQGMEAEVQAPTIVGLRTGVHADRVAAYVAEWSRVIGAEARVEEVEQEVKQKPASAMPPPRLGEILVRKGFISQDQLIWALDEARARNRMLGLVLLEKNMIFEDELARTLSEQLDIPYVSVMRIGADPAAARLLPREVGEAAAAIPVRMRRGVVQVIFADPTDQRARAAVEKHLPKIDVAVGELSDIRLAWREVSKSS